MGFTISNYEPLFQSSLSVCLFHSDHNTPFVTTSQITNPPYIPSSTAHIIPGPSVITHTYMHPLSTGPYNPPSKRTAKFPNQSTKTPHPTRAKITNMRQVDVPPQAGRAAIGYRDYSNEQRVELRVGPRKNTEIWEETLSTGLRNDDVYTTTSSGIVEISLMDLSILFPAR